MDPETTSSGQPVLPEITFISTGEVYDLVFRIVDGEIQPEGNAWIEAYGVHEGERVGLRVELIGPWKEKILQGDFHIFQGKVRYVPTGEASDRLVQVMRRLYGSSIQADRMNSNGILFTGISIEGNPASVEDQALTIKLFIEAEDAEDDDQFEERYTELFTKINVSAGWLEICEKDPEYRDPLMRALSGM